MEPPFQSKAPHNHISRKDYNSIDLRRWRESREKRKGDSERERRRGDGDAAKMYSGACISPLQPTSCLPLYQSVSKRAGTPSIFTQPQIPLLISTNLLKPPYVPHIHTYIHKHIFMEARGKPRGIGTHVQEGGEDKDHLEFKVEDCVPLWTDRKPHRLGLMVKAQAPTPQQRGRQELRRGLGDGCQA